MRSLVLVATLAGTANASSMTVSGEVIETRSHWTADGSRIVTEATVHTDTGDVVVSQLGGTVDGIGMRTFPGPEPLVQGMSVTVAATPSMDLSQQVHNVVDGVKVISTPPGYVRTGPTQSGNSLYWESGCVFVTVDSAGTKYVAGDQEFSVIDQAISTWNTASDSCSYIKILDEGRKAVETGRDNVNIIKFRDVTWCRPASKDDPARCHPDSAAGITTATFVDDTGSARDGAIVDADVELNGVGFAIAVNGQTLSTESCISELKNTLTHELGHLLGFEHTCRAAGDPERIDDQGRAVPSCSTTTDPAIIGATMYNFQECGEAKKETLEADDIAGLCGVYPAAKDPGTCEPVGDPGGCDTGQRSGSSLLLSALVGLLLMTRFWRRR